MLPFQLPVLAVKGLPTAAVPLIVGRAVLVGPLPWTLALRAPPTLGNVQTASSAKVSRPARPGLSHLRHPERSTRSLRLEVGKPVLTCILQSGRAASPSSRMSPGRRLGAGSTRLPTPTAAA